MTKDVKNLYKAWLTIWGLSCNNTSRGEAKLWSALYADLIVIIAISANIHAEAGLAKVLIVIIITDHIFDDFPFSGVNATLLHVPNVSVAFCRFLKCESGNVSVEEIIAS